MMIETRFVPCPDRIEVDKSFGEMSVDQLLTLKSMILMCKGCSGCDGMLADINTELEIIEAKNKDD